MRSKNHTPNSNQHRPGFLRRLGQDQRGNALLIMTAAIVPIAGMIGSGLDMSRAYMAKAKLQTACDATALATRRFMASSQVSEEARAEGRKFFAFNFPAGTMDTTPVALTIEPAADDLSMVEVKATTQIPTTIMQIFGARSIALEASCSADQDFVNNDIMVVLDVTLSMNCEAGKVGTYCTTEKSGGLSRVARVRSAGVALYDALAGAAGVRTRYGFMPYSMTVNLGDTLPDTYRRNPSRYLDANHVLATRANHVAADYVTFPCVEERSTIAQNSDPNVFKIGEAVEKADVDTVSTTDEKLKWQPYDPVAQKMETSGGLDASLASFCPNKASRLTTYATKATFQTALNASLQKVGGYTFHDIGMMWAMRYLSSTGMFAADNPVELPNAVGPPTRVDKHIVFLTDGELIVNANTYSAFGVDTYDKRMIGTAAQEAKHKAHFLSACNRARQMGMTVWVIAIDVGASEDIKSCASGDDHFYESNGKDLDKIFSLIGKGIGRLRITK